MTLLLKDISDSISPLDTQTRERLIQSGIHYSEMLPVEYQPSEEYLAEYRMALAMYSKLTATTVAIVSEKIFAEKGENAVLVSMARAGTSTGILIRRYLKKKYAISLPHYSISIIRGKGIDHCAMKYILERHEASQIQFVDGWTGKGAIQRELTEAMTAYPAVSPGLAVLSDPAYAADKCGTHMDFLIPSSCLNATVSGLISRTVSRSDLVGENDFHGAVFYGNLEAEDLTYEFIDTVECQFPSRTEHVPDAVGPMEKASGIKEVRRIAEEFDIEDLNLIKPSIGEATRVLLRRVPWKVLIHSKNDEAYLGHLYRLAAEKNVEVVEYPLINYKACGLIRALSDV